MRVPVPPPPPRPPNLCSFSLFLFVFLAVRCRDAASRAKGESINDGLEAEEEFFRTVEPWRSLQSEAKAEADPIIFLGCKALRIRLASLLLQRINDQLPSVCLEIRGMLVKAEESLAKMPLQLDSPTARRMEFEKCTEQVRDLVQNTITPLTISFRRKGIAGARVLLRGWVAFARRFMI